MASVRNGEMVPRCGSNRMKSVVREALAHSLSATTPSICGGVSVWMAEIVKPESGA